MICLLNLLRKRVYGLICTTEPHPFLCEGHPTIGRLKEDEIHRGADHRVGSDATVVVLIGDIWVYREKQI